MTPADTRPAPWCLAWLLDHSRGLSLVAVPRRGDEPTAELVEMLERLPDGMGLFVERELLTDEVLEIAVARFLAQGEYILVRERPAVARLAQDARAVISASPSPARSWWRR